MLRERRNMLGITLKAAAEATRVDQGQLSRIERGQEFPGREAALRIADFYGVDVRDVLYPDRGATAKEVVA